MGQVEYRDVSFGIALERPLDVGCSLEVYLYGSDFGPVDGLTNVEIPNGGSAWCATEAGLLVRAFGYLVGQVVGVELGDGTHDAVHQHATRCLVDVFRGGD
ncbi:hypothetical protein QP027_04760 [Corynebacterium breve]|uniref:Uncharacterized protein n=1 Tax=Corynebacterium breve TaxID=3049799 RepID=A0ABY8VGB1_9CORY|nr:hypothetical protein [Corynebacterium breve]WIM68701.1 hypothetical protein QP027_04760 [Corynebacterium breve]